MGIYTGKAERVIVLVCDGLRPDLVTPTLTPTLSRLCAEGVVGADHHAVFPSMTRVNVSSVVTGVYPAKHGIMGNSVYVPEVNREQAISTGEYALLRRWHQSAAGPLLLVPSIGEYLWAAGKKMAVISTGSSGSAFLLYHRVEEEGGLLIHPAFILPETATDTVIQRCGPFPSEATPNIARNEHALRILFQYVLPELQPDLALLWLSEPDKTLHAFGLHTPELEQAIRHLDSQIACLLKVLISQGLKGTTDLIVTSDHGVSTILQPVDVPSTLSRYGFSDILHSRALIVARGGGASLLYLQEGYKAKVEEVVHFLHTQDWVGPIFTRDPLPGTLPLSLIGNANDRAADILFSLRWNGQEPSGPQTGGIASDDTFPAGRGMHGSFSPFEMHNFLLATGPDFKQGRVSVVPSGSIDLVPTILTLLGVPLPSDLDGRVLIEMYADAIAPEEVCFEKRVVRSEAAGSFRSVVQFSEVSGVRYFDKGMVIHSQ